MEEATSRTLFHLPGKSLEGTLSLVPLGTHPMMGPGASHPGCCDHHKSRGALGDTIEKHKIKLLIDTGASISAIPFSPGLGPPKKITVQGISGQPLECHFTEPLACSWEISTSVTPF
jgi:hypothetical protein